MVNVLLQELKQYQNSYISSHQYILQSLSSWVIELRDCRIGELKQHPELVSLRLSWCTDMYGQHMFMIWLLMTKQGRIQKGRGPTYKIRILQGSEMGSNNSVPVPCCVGSDRVKHVPPLPSSFTAVKRYTPHISWSHHNLYLTSSRSGLALVWKLMIMYRSNRKIELA